MKISITHSRMWLAYFVQILLLILIQDCVAVSKDKSTNNLTDTYYGVLNKARRWLDDSVWIEEWGETLTNRYYRCTETLGCTVEKCADGEIFDRETLECVKHRIKRQIGIVGQACSESTECGTGGYCDSTKRCTCLSSYVQIQAYCWAKINPGQGGCQYNEQCSAVWPSAYCSSSQTCRCGNNAPPFPTRDGDVCVNYGFCPINGEYTKLKLDSGQTVSCQNGDDAACWVANPPTGTSTFSTYDCHCNTQDCAQVTFCCPTRGLACIMPQDAGSSPATGGGTVTRFYYNSITSNCETFSYRGAQGNANNFQSKNQCESYCKRSCSRGQPLYRAAGGSLASGIKLVDAIATCTDSSSSRQCGRDYQCDTIGTNQICCPTVEFICSRNGGTPVVPPTGNFDSGSSGGSSVSYSRFYFNEATNLCQPFTYLGQEGNYNNFLSRDQCNRFCARSICDAGEPLKDNGGLRNRDCSGNGNCPDSYECNQGVCCPKKQTVCSLTRAVGSCGNYVERWWYNAATQNCESFTFSGCQGNANNFDTYDNCQTYCRDTNVQPKCPQGKPKKDSYGNYIICGGRSQLSGLQQTCPANYQCFYDGNNYGCCETQAYTCQVSFDVGTRCGPIVSRWYYNQATGTCATFSYNGCDGNSNNFATQTDCNDYCGVGGCPDGGSPFRESNGLFRVCSGGLSCPNTHFCTRISLSNTNTNINNYCCPTRTYICSLPNDGGTQCGSSTLTRYFFNVARQNCESFSFNGCGGNRNNFPVLSQCLNYCNSAGCPSGTVALQDSQNNRLNTCTLGQSGTCPNSYNCIYSQLLGQNICCGSNAPADTCPSGQSAFIDAKTNGPKRCQPNVAGSCPSGFICWYSATQNKFSCCGNSVVQCPQGGSAYIDSVSNQARQCTPGVVGACPSSYVCQPTPINIQNVQSTTGYCCGGSNVCGENYVAELVNRQPRQCVFNSFNTLAQCTSPYQCRQASAGSYCCLFSQTSTPQVNVCASVGTVAYQVNGSPVVCTTGSTSTNCPSPYSCVNYSPTNTFYCCQTNGQVQPNPVPTAACPPGFSSTGTTCFSANGCVSPAYCQFGSTPGQGTCCQSASVQPTVQAMCPSTNSISTQPCPSGVCQPGLICTPTQAGQYCCPTGQSRRPCIPILFPGSQTPLQCQAGSTQCPGGECKFSTQYNTNICCQQGTGRAARLKKDQHKHTVDDHLEDEHDSQQSSVWNHA